MRIKHQVWSTPLLQCLRISSIALDCVGLYHFFIVSIPNDPHSFDSNLTPSQQPCVVCSYIPIRTDSIHIPTVIAAVVVVVPIFTAIVWIPTKKMNFFFSVATTTPVTTTPFHCIPLHPAQITHPPSPLLHQSWGPSSISRAPFQQSCTPLPLAIPCSISPPPLPTGK